MWFIGVEVEQKTSVPPPKKNPGSAPETVAALPSNDSFLRRVLRNMLRLRDCCSEFKSLANKTFCKSGSSPPMHYSPESQ